MSYRLVDSSAAAENLSPPSVLGQDYARPLPGEPAISTASAGPIWLYQALRILFLAGVDAVALSAAVGAAYWSWALSVLDQPASLYYDVAGLLMLMPLGYAAAGLYPGFGIGAVETLRRFSYCTAFGFMAIAASSFLFKLPSTHSRLTFLIAFLLASILVPATRFIALSMAVGWRWWTEPVILVGDGPWLVQTIRSLGKARSIGFRPVGILAANPETRAVEGVPFLDDAEAARYLAAGSCRTVMVSDSEEHLARVGDLQRYFGRVIVVRRHMEIPVDGARTFNLGGVLGIEFRSNLLRWQNRFLKRFIDIAAGGAALMLAAPLLLLAAVFVKATSRGPVFFGHERTGLEGEPVTVWKLRTMRVDAEARLERLLLGDPAMRDEWDRNLKLRRDPRVIRGGALIRRFSLDELPQLWGVVRGRMSLVGPRPLPGYHLRRFPTEFRELRHRVRPGMTGLWQVMARGSGGLEEHEIHDRYYIRNWSIWLDLYILARTTLTVLAGRGAY